VVLSGVVNSFLQVNSPEAPVFLADIDRARGILRLHVRRGVNVQAARERAYALMATQERPLGIVVQQHRREDLTQPRSLEHWVARFALGEVVYDPMLVVTRARYLVGVAQRVRRSLGRRGKGVYYDASRNMLVVVVRPIGDREEAATLVQREVDKAREEQGFALGATPTGSGISIRIVSERPGLDLVPVDRLSNSLLIGLRRIARPLLAPVAMVLAGLAAISPAAASAGSRQVPKTSEAAAFGVLTGLSLSADSSYRQGLDSFAAAALEMYFGRTAAAEKAIQLAQANSEYTTQNVNQQNMSTTSTSPGS
jgi:hypothetical protein